MKSLTLWPRLLLLTLLPSALAALALIVYFTWQAIETQRESLHEAGLATVSYLAPVSEYGVLAGHLPSLQAVLQAGMQRQEVKALAILGRDARLLASSGRLSLPAKQWQRLPRHVEQIGAGPGGLTFAAPVKRSTLESDPLFDEPQGQGVEVIGAVIVELDTTPLAEQKRRLLIQGSALAALGLGLLAAFASLAAHAISRPILTLARAVDEMAAGRLDVRVPEVSPGEIGVLERGFNAMTEHIAQTQHTLEERIAEATQLLNHQAHHDPLTGLPNRREFEKRIEQAIATLGAGGPAFSLLFIDLDRFKEVNDTSGHLAGDELLRQVAQLMKSRLREVDLLARVGGDEFCVLLHDCDFDAAQQVANDLCALVNGWRFVWHDRVFSIGASIGIARSGALLSNPAELIAQADAACYQAKQSGRGRACTHPQPGEKRPAEERRQHAQPASAPSCAGITEDNGESQPARHGG